MRRIVFCVLMSVFISVAAQGQYEYIFKPFKVDASLGFAGVMGKGSKSGILFAVEPKYAVLPQISVGLRMEAAVVARFSGYNSSGDELDINVKASASYLLTGDYYLNNNYSFRPFAGAGAGVYKLASGNVSNSTAGVDASTEFGGMIRAGFESSHFRFGLEYNIVPETTFDGYDSNGNAARLTSKSSYIGVKVGVCIGGGPLK